MQPRKNWHALLWLVKDRSVLGGIYTGVPLGQRSSRRQVLLAHNCIRNHKINRDWLTRVDAERGARVEGLLESSAYLRSECKSLYSSLGKHSLLTKSLQKNRFPAGGCTFYRSPDDAFVGYVRIRRLHFAMRRSSCRRTTYPCVLESTYATLSFHYDLHIRSVLLSLLSRFSPFRHFPRHSFLFYYFSLLLCISSPAVCGLEKRSLQTLPREKRESGLKRVD